MENEDIKKTLVELIKKFDNKCPDCEKIFLGAAIVGSTEAGNYPVDVGLVDYPLSCGKCPDCAQKCYEGLHEYVRKKGKIPCNDCMIYECIGIENEEEFTDGEIDEFLNELKYEIECVEYCDENFQWDNLSYGNPNVHGGILINLFEFFEKGIRDVVEQKEYEMKISLIWSLEKSDNPQSLVRLIELLDDKDSRVKIRVIEALGNKRDSLTIKELSKCLNNEKTEIRLKAIEAIGKKNDSGLIEMLFNLSASDNERIREKVIETLGKNNSFEVINYLIEKLKSEDNEVWGISLKIFSRKGANKLLIEKLPTIRNIIYEKFSLLSSDQIKQFAYILNWAKPNSMEYLTNKNYIESPENKRKLLDLIEEIEVVSSEISFRGTRIPKFEAEVLQSLEQQSIYISNFQLIDEIESGRYKLNIENIHRQAGYFVPALKAPESAFSIENNRITKIRCHSYRVIKIPENIGKLKYLKLLDLRRKNPMRRDDNVTTLPKSFGDLKSLKILNLVGTELKALPESFGNLKSLEFLNLIYNKLTTLPESIQNLKSLKTLNLGRNKFTTFPESIVNLPSLKILCFYDNKLTILPDSIDNLKSLEILHLENNKLESLPSSIGNILSLKELILKDNQLVNLPITIGKLEALEILNLWRNKLKSLPESIGNLRSLKNLNLKNNRLEQLPDSMSNLKSLIELHLRENSIRDFPESISKLESLKILYINFNHLKNLSESIGNLKSLQTLVLRYNSITTLPESILNLESLKILDLYNNPLDEKSNSLLELLKKKNVQFRFP